MDKSPIATTILASCFQFYVSIVDPSILGQTGGVQGPAGTVPAAAEEPGAPPTASAAPAVQQNSGTSGAFNSALPASSGQTSNSLH